MKNWLKKVFCKKKKEEQENAEIHEENEQIDSIMEGISQNISDSIFEKMAGMAKKIQVNQDEKEVQKHIQQLMDELEECGSQEASTFKKEEISEAVNQILNMDDVVATMQFIIGKEDIQILYTYDLATKETVGLLADFLFRLNDGQFSDEIATLMLKNSLHSPRDDAFIRLLFDKWKQYSEEGQGSPAVSPLDFN